MAHYYIGDDKYEISDNQLIAKFMGARTTKAKEVNALMWVCEGYRLHGKLAFNHNLKYHKSWDWLMPVIDKIEEFGYHVTTQSYQCQIWDKNPSKECIEKLGDLAGMIIDADFNDDKFQNAYEGVVAFIMWYNEKLRKEKTKDKE